MTEAAQAQGGAGGTGAPTGEQGQGGAGGGQENLGWRAALPDEYKEHELVKAHTKPGDFVKWAVGVKTEADGLKTRLASVPVKPGEGAKPEEILAYRKAVGIPEKATEYVLPEVAGRQNNPQMVTWAQTVFHKHGLTADQAKGIGGEWNQFIQAMEASEEKSAKEQRDAAEGVLKKELGSDEKYKEGVELVARFLKESATPEELQFLQETQVGGGKLGNHPTLVRMVLRFAKKTGEDNSPAGSGGGGPQTEGMVYDKSPVPPKN